MMRVLHEILRPAQRTMDIGSSRVRVALCVVCKKADFSRVSPALISAATLPRLIRIRERPSHEKWRVESVFVRPAEPKTDVS